MKNNNVVLIGFAGTGKSTIGELLAKKLGWTHVDTDRLIEAKVEKTISQLFATEGEAYFRQIESEVIRDTLSHSEQVISTGGGAVLAAENREQMVSNGIVIALVADAETIIERAKGDQNRPLFQGDVRDKVLRLLEQRKHAYDFANLRFDTSAMTSDDVTAALHNAVEQWLI